MALSKIDSVALGANAVANSIGYQPMGNTSGSISTALGYTPMGNSSGSVTGALGFTPANKAGDTITGAMTFSNTTAHTGTATFSNTVGIGTGSPTTGTRLDIVSDSTSTQYVNVIRAKTSDSGDYHPFVLLENNRGGTANAIRIGMDTSASLGDSYILFQLKDSGGTFNNRMYIKSTGQVLMPAQPAFAAWGNGGNNGSGSAGNVTALTAKFNVGNHFSAGVFTAPITGVYEFAWSISSGGVPRSRIRINGSDYFGALNGAGVLQLRGEVGGTNLWGVFLVQMAANDTAQIYTESTYSTESAYLYFQGRLVQ